MSLMFAILTPMEALKQEKITSEMRDSLSVNRDGKLTTAQWKQIVTEPLVRLLLLMIPGLVVLGPRLASFIFGGLWFVGVIAVVGLGLMLLARAMYYARIPLHFGVFHAADLARPRWAFWRGDLLYNEANKPVRFGKRLVPRLRLQSGQSYLIYYLKDSGSNILLSIAPADHDDAHRWQPTPSFQGRSARRGER